MPRPGAPRRGLALDANDLGLLGVVVIWGLNMSIVKTVLKDMSPLAFNAVRFTLASATLLALLHRFGESFRTSRKDMLSLLGLGLIGHTAYQVLFIEGISLTTASHTALIFGISPVVVAILSQRLGHEHVSAASWAGAVLAFGGEYLIIAAKAPVEGPPSSLRGDLLVLAAAFCWCFYTVLARPLLAKHSPLKVTALSMSWGYLAMIPLCIPSVLRQSWGSLGWKVWGGIFYSFLFALVVSYLLWYRSVHKVGNVRTAVYSNLVPVSGTLAGWAFLGERLYPALALGAGAIFAGILLTRRQQDTTPVEAGPEPEAPS